MCVDLVLVQGVNRELAAGADSGFEFVLCVHFVRETTAEKKKQQIRLCFY